MPANASDRLPSGIVLDAGPVIALAYQSDRDHAMARTGFDALITARSRLIIPLPIMFEVYKWLVYEAGAAVGQTALAHMHRALEIVFPSQRDFDDTVALVGALGPGWKGSLEDALVAAVAIRLRLPAWTLNYRDLGAFPRLQLWAP
ncbi:MAG TPA: type II toxin-antitoxin system VapC family toxin [bacterium]|nr:type II toxin-antitoxin system VapC family toxin [bacterium]